MSIAFGNLSRNPTIRASAFFTNNPLLSPVKTLRFTLSLRLRPFNTFPQSLKINSPSTINSIPSSVPVKALQSGGSAVEVQGGEIDLDGFLSVVEFLCLASSMVISVGFAANLFISTSQKPIIAWLGNRGLVLQSVLLVIAATIGSILRRRQWLRICIGSSKSGSSGVNLMERVEKLEEDLRSSVAIVRVLSRQLEKLGIRFRVTRKGLKDPISETAALAQKNSEATRTLALQGEVLEHELAEIQNVLLAMQEQQQKQLELILAIGKTRQLWVTKPVPNQQEEAPKSAKGGKPTENQQEIQSIAKQKEASMDTV